MILQTFMTFAYFLEMHDKITDFDGTGEMKTQYDFQINQKSDDGENA
mgnify:CR=1 FL=1